MELLELPPGWRYPTEEELAKTKNNGAEISDILKKPARGTIYFSSDLAAWIQENQDEQRLKIFKAYQCDINLESGELIGTFKTKEEAHAVLVARFWMDIWPEKE